MSESDGGDRSGGSSTARYGQTGDLSLRRVGRVAATITILLAVTGLAFGLIPMTYGSYGGEQYDTPGSSDEEPTDEEETRADALFKNQVINTIVSIVPYLAIAMAIGAGFAAGIVGSGSHRELGVGAAAGAFLGVTLYVFLASAIAMQQWWWVEGVLFEQRWLQWDDTIVNAVLYAIPATIVAPVASSAGLVLRS